MKREKLLSQQVDSIAVSLFVNDLVEFDNNNNTVSDNKIQISILVLRRDALYQRGAFLNWKFLEKWRRLTVDFNWFLIVALKIERNSQNTPCTKIVT